MVCQPPINLGKKGNPLYIQERIPGLYYGDPMAQVCIDKGFKKACVITDINEAFLSWGKRFKEKFEAWGDRFPHSSRLTSRTRRIFIRS